jgi:Ca2+/Na+ antiporter
MGNSKFHKMYKLRFIPLVITGFALIIVLLLKYVWQVEVGRFLGWTIFLCFAAFIFYRAMLEKKHNNEKEEELVKNPPPPPTKEELQQKYEDEMQGGIEQQKTNIAFRSLYLFFGVLVVLLAISLIVSNKEYIFGIVTLIVGILFTIHSVFVLRKWIKYYKIFKEEKNKKIFDTKIH